MLALSLLCCLTPQVGVNLEPVRDWHRQTPFVDAFKSARPWISHQAGTHPSGFAWGGGPPAQLDAKGWPQSLQPHQWLESIVYADQGGNYPSGVYTIRWDGGGTIEPRAGGNGQLTVLHQAPGLIRCALRVPTQGLFSLRITSMAQPIRNVRVYLPGWDQSRQVFSPDFLASLKPFQAVRFMNWQRINDSPVRAWAEVPGTNHYTQATDAGVAPAYMAQLCNELGADMWLCVPHLATNHYVASLAQLIDKALRRDLTLYLEYSNEVWNSQFGQNAYAASQGQALGLGSTPWVAAWRYYAQRSVEVFQVFQAELRVDRELVRVLAGQSVNPWVGTQIMDWQNAYQHADAYAVAPYWGGSLGSASNAATTAAMDLRTLLYACDLNSQQQHQLRTSQNAIEAQQRGLALLAYEGGQHLVGVGAAQNNQTLTDLFVAANRHPAMRSLYFRDLLRWDANGGGLFMAYRLTGQPSRFGSFGLLEYQNQPLPAAHKLRGLLEFMSR